MLDFESRRIRDLRGIDFSKLEFEDLRWKYGTFQSVSTGSGCDKKYSSWSGVKTRIGEIEAELAGCGRVLVRPSGTEALVRVMLEGPDEAMLHRSAEDLAALLRARLS